jgi:hypothetical protein
VLVIVQLAMSFTLTLGQITKSEPVNGMKIALPDVLLLLTLPATMVTLRVKRAVYVMVQ